MVICISRLLKIVSIIRVGNEIYDLIKLTGQLLFTENEKIYICGEDEGWDSLRISYNARMTLSVILNN
jgi:hypothetical protein